MAEILASLDDINANLDKSVVEATDENTELLQISVARIIRGYLSNAIDNVTIMSWRAPDGTPELIREAAGKLIAAQHYFNEISKTTDVIEANSFSQKRYDEAMAILNGILLGNYVLPDVVLVGGTDMTILDSFPIDATGRKFSMDMIL